MQEKLNVKLIVTSVIVLIVMFVASFTAYIMLRPQGTEGAKQISIAVTVDGATVKSLNVNTNSEFLLEVLLDNNLVQGEQSAFGYWVTAVDGIVPDEDNQEWWALYHNGEFAMYGPDQTVLEDGDSFEYRLTVGW